MSLFSDFKIIVVYVFGQIYSAYKTSAKLELLVFKM